MTDQELPIEMPDAAWLGAFRRRLKSWYAKHARDLPWRRTRDPYAIWISETMLQQTLVETVIPYYDRFLGRLPTVADLAAADEETVLRLWEGLGYYRRARQLHAAAKVIVDQHGGAFPSDFDDILALPGVGRYTAGAITSFAFDQRWPILEANTIRLHARLLAYRDDPRKAAGQRTLWAMAERVLPKKNVGLFNQALMELGGQACSIASPRCEACPASELCRARIEGAQGEIPLKAERKKLTAKREAAVIVRRGKKVLLVRYAENVRWAGLWDFPRFETPDVAPRRHASDDMLREGVERMTGVRIEPGRRLTTIRHGVTRYAITLDAHAASFIEQNGAAPHPSIAEVRWAPIDAIDDYPLSSTGRKLCRWVNDA